MLPNNKPASYEAYLMMRFGLSYKECRRIVADASINVGSSFSGKLIQEECIRLAEARVARKRANGKCESGSRLKGMQNANHASISTLSSTDTATSIDGDFVALLNGQVDGNHQFKSMVIVGFAKEVEATSTAAAEECDSKLDCAAQLQQRDNPKSQKGRQKQRDANIPSNIYILHKKSPTKRKGFLQRLKTSFPSPVQPKPGALDNNWHGNSLVNL